MRRLNSTIILALVLLSSAGCPLTMEPVFNKLHFKNNSATKITLLLNLSYPDSSLSNAFVNRYMKPHSDGYVGNIYELEDYIGLSIIIFDDAYFDSRWHEQVGKPDTYLEEDKILKRFVMSKSKLDSLNWKLTYP